MRQIDAMRFAGDRTWQWLTFGAVIVVVFIALLRGLGAHEWYPPLCCSGGDCAPLVSSRVEPIPEGFMVDGRFVVPRSEVKDSMDGRYHACFPNPEILRCFFAPPSGS